MENLYIRYGASAYIPVDMINVLNVDLIPSAFAIEFDSNPDGDDIPTTLAYAKFRNDRYIIISEYDHPEMVEYTLKHINTLIESPN